MRYLLLALMLLFAGCLAPGAPPADQTQAPQPEPAAPAGEPAAAAEVSANLTIPADNTAQIPGNETGQSASQGGNETPPEGNETQAPEQETTTPPEGLAFGNGSYLLAFDDASVIPVSTEPCGIFSLWLANGSLMEKMYVCPGESEMWTSPAGGEFRILVQQVAAGYSKNASWAKVIIYGEDPPWAAGTAGRNESEGGGSRLREKCCGECVDAYSQSPVAVGPHGAQCGHFITGKPISDECGDYFEAYPSTVSGCG